MLLGLGLAAGSASGQCDPDAFLSFSTQAIRSQDALIDVQSMAIAEAPADVDLPLGTVAVGGAGIAPGGGPAFPLRVPVERFTWRLITFAGAGVDAADLRVELSIDNGGALTSLANSGSRVQVDVVNRTINTNNIFIFTVFDGFVDLLLDPSVATRAGNYSGTLNIEVGCE